ncbi:3-oxoacyl-[acyl-carrier-protein] synthase, KASII [hydrothermal vent metagenome]|uniref:Nodulation protein E n=1 Tax=hydrothermal vent metagenome TaxID=652676 RepID=A0A3B0Y8B9_9ZZZZ
MRQRVVITGVGAISGLGTDAQTMWNAMCQGQSAIKPLGDLAAGTRISVGSTVPDYEANKYFTGDELPLLDRFSQFAILAARDALQDAGLSADAQAISKAAAVIGTGCGGKQTDEETYAGLYRDKRKRAHPLTIPKGMPSAAASQVSQHLGICGPVYSVASACASAAHAVLQGKLLIQAGMVDVALVGGSDTPFTYGLLKAWEALRVVSSDACRPFSKDRSGMVLGEGAGMLVLESEKHATERGGRIYAELAGCGLSSNAGHITRPDVEGISSAIASALKDAGLKPEDIDYINAHGTATATNDPAETAAIHAVFGTHARRLAISSSKSMLGHALGAASALELIATVLAVYHDVVPPTMNFTGPGEGCDLDYVPNEARKQPVNTALSNAFAFGGLNAVLAVSSWRES